MNKIWFGLAFSVMVAVAGPAPAQNDNKNFVACMKELGLPADAGNPSKTSGHDRLETLNLNLKTLRPKGLKPCSIRRSLRVAGYEHRLGVRLWAGLAAKSKQNAMH